MRSRAAFSGLPGGAPGQFPPWRIRIPAIPWIETRAARSCLLLSKRRLPINRMRLFACKRRESGVHGSHHNHGTRPLVEGMEQWRLSEPMTSTVASTKSKRCLPTVTISTQKSTQVTRPAPSRPSPIGTAGTTTMSRRRNRTVDRHDLAWPGLASPFAGPTGRPGDEGRTGRLPSIPNGRPGQTDCGRPVVAWVHPGPTALSLSAGTDRPRGNSKHTLR